MNPLETYILLFTDTLVSNLAINSSYELVIHSMKIFGQYNSYLIIFVASSAFAVSCLANYLLGIICFRILSPLSPKESETAIRTEKIRDNKYLPLLLLLSAFPFFGKFVILIAGFCKTRLLLTIIIAALAKFVYYSFLMFEPIFI